MTLGTFAAQSYQYPLDMVGSASFAYSTRQLSKSFSSPIMNIRRASDNSTTNLSFDTSGKISNSSPVSAGGNLGTWMSGTNVFITSWTDQSANGNTVSQPTANLQPQLAASGVLISPGPQYFPTTNITQIFLSALTQGTLSTPFTSFAVAEYNTTTASNYAVCDSWSATPARYVVRFNGSSGTPQWNMSNGTVTSTIGASVNTKYLISGYNDASSSSIYINGTLNNTVTGTNTVGFTGISIGRVAGTSGQMSGFIMEIIVYNSDLSRTQFEAMNSNIRNFWGV